MRRSYLGAWLIILACACAGVEWVTFGKAYARSRLFGVPPVSEASRTETRFVAVLLPRIAAGPGKYAMSSANLTGFLDGLKASGYVSISLDDVAGLYTRGRRLPPKAVLLAFAEDDPQGLELADDALRSARLRGAAFLTRTAAPGEEQRRFLTAHAVDQMRRGGAWSFGRVSQETPSPIPGAGEVLAALDDGRRAAAPRPEPCPLRFVVSAMGLDDAGDDPRALRVLALRSDRTPEEDLRLVRDAWPRAAEFVDDFSEDGLGADWIPAYGAVSRGEGRLAFLPTPRQSGAGVYLRGTEKWRDVTLEFELKRFQKEFWAYARYRPDGGFVRFGARGDSWYVEQKAGARSRTRQLARARILAGDFPARVRLVVKDGALLAYVNGRMEFGRLLPVEPGTGAGSLFLGVYDPRTRSSQAVLTSLRAAPLGEEWLAPKNGASRLFDEGRLEGLRTEAVAARALSPFWIEVGPDGGVTVDETQGILLRSLAGFYGCRLLPMAEFSAASARSLGSFESAERAAVGLTDAAGRLSVPGLNLRLRGGDVERPETVAFLRKLHAIFRARRLELWVTMDGVSASDRALTGAVDGVLRPSFKKRADLEILEAARDLPRAAEGLAAGTTARAPLRAPAETNGRAQWEPASIQ